jgi:hypothetical protein
MVQYNIWNTIVKLFLKYSVYSRYSKRNSIISALHKETKPSPHHISEDINRLLELGSAFVHHRNGNRSIHKTKSHFTLKRSAF